MKPNRAPLWISVHFTKHWSLLPFDFPTKDEHVDLEAVTQLVNTATQ